MTKINYRTFKKKIIFAFIVCSFTLSKAFADLVVFAEGFQPHANLIKDFEATTGEKVIITDVSFKDNYASLLNYSNPATLSQPNSVKPDLFITKDLVYMNQLKMGQHTQAFDVLPEFQSLQPGMMDSKDLHWVGLTFRARTLVYRDDVDVSQINAYEDLASKDWNGSLCLRKADNSYNYALVSYMIENYGYEDAKQILLGWLDDLALPIDDKGDSAIITSVSTGECDLGIVNHYYLAREYVKAEGEGRSLNVNIKYLNQNGTQNNALGKNGVHVNGYGVALLKTSQQKDLAQQFVKMLLSEKAQLEMAASQFTFPVIKPWTEKVMNEGWGTFNYDSKKGWGKFESSPLDWSVIGKHLDTTKNQKNTINLMLETGYLPKL